MSRTLAILCCSPRSFYKTLADVTCYDAKRDVRSFTGEMPVVCHPPCRAWSIFLSHQAKPPPGEKELGPLCVDWLRRCGGVLEHPAHSRLWDACHLPPPGQRSGDLFTIYVERHWFGPSPFIKQTWLCLSRIDPSSLVIPFALRPYRDYHRAWQLASHSSRSAASPAFANWLVATARTAV